LVLYIKERLILLLRVTVETYTDQVP